MESLLQDFNPQFGKLESELTQLGVEFARGFVKDIVASAKDGYVTTKKLM